MGKKVHIVMIVIPAIVLIGVGLILNGSYQHITGAIQTEKNNQNETVKPHISIDIDDGEKIATEEASASTPFEALEVMTKANNLSLKTKQYDFGVFVQEVGSKISGADKSWIYFVNGKSGTVAADKQKIQERDHISWRYIKPTNE